MHFFSSKFCNWPPFRLIFSKFKVYGLALTLIIVWWAIAFSPKSYLSQTIDISLEKLISTSIEDQNIVAHINVDRSSLKQALGGDFALMTRLIADWDIDAQLLEAKGFSDIQRLPHRDFLRTQLLGRAITNPNKNELIRLKSESVIPAVTDDLSNKINLKDKYRRFLPQTYSSASFLLALVPPSQIVALPSRLREKTELYPKALTDLIRLDIDRYNAEKLFEERPEIAFVAHYSHPSTLQALRSQGIQLYMMKELNTLEAINQELMNIGRLVDRPIEAELMQFFLSAASIALDNKLTLMNNHLFKMHKPLPTVLYVNYHHNFSIPTAKTLTGHFLRKIATWDISLKYGEDHGLHELWTIPIDKEHIVNLNPDCLIIVAEHPKALEEQMLHDAALQQIKAVKNHQLYFVNECIQQSPCQYIILAYCDLIDALASIKK
ncbi:MAG: ABC transporter substrate-binding protein [Parachlamydiaceae bacterium]|nr:ABC transporter substrate-binding protein [Parachlamydiaceae bacterium]